jgi:hypothetical protein
MRGALDPRIRALVVESFMKRIDPVELSCANRQKTRDGLAFAIDRVLAVWDSPVLDNKLFLASFAVVLFGVCLARAYAGLARIEASWMAHGGWRTSNYPTATISSHWDRSSSIRPVSVLHWHMAA